MDNGFTIYERKKSSDAVRLSLYGMTAAGKKIGGFDFFLLLVIKPRCRRI